jgi:hypothetical protein
VPTQIIRAAENDDARRLPRQDVAGKPLDHPARQFPAHAAYRNGRGCAKPFL